MLKFINKKTEKKDGSLQIAVVTEPNDKIQVKDASEGDEEEGTDNSYPYGVSSDEDYYTQTDTEATPDGDGPICEENPHFFTLRSCLVPSIASSDLHTIEEEEWGSPPSENSASDDYTSSFDTEDLSLNTDEESDIYTSYEEETDHYENFEMVLQDEQLKGPVKERLQDTLMHRKRAMEVKEEAKGQQRGWTRFSVIQKDPDPSIKDNLFCEPCEDEAIEAKPKPENSQSKQSMPIMQRIFRGQDKNPKKSIEKYSDAVNKSINAPGPTKPKKKAQEEWKAAIQQDTGRVYYYHSKTRETTWIRPQSFVLWKMVIDKTSNRPYFYNRITKETTWDVPSDFDPWKSYVDANSGKTYYFNVMTRETTWTRPMPIKEIRTSPEKDEALENEELTAPIVRLPSPKKNKESNALDETLIAPVTTSPSRSKDQGSKELQHEAFLSPAVISNSSTGSKSQDDHEGEDQGTEYDDESEEGEDEEKDIESIEDTMQNESKDRVLLQYLLHTYAPAYAEKNAALMRHSKGNEVYVISHLETIIEDTPFDEVHTAIYNYACSAINQTSAQSIRPKTEQSEPNYKGYMLNHPILSAISTRTDHTERVKNVSRSQSPKSWNKSYSRERVNIAVSESDSESSRGDNRELEMKVLWPGGSTPTRQPVAESTSEGLHKHSDGLSRIRSKAIKGSGKSPGASSQEGSSSQELNSFSDLTDTYRSRRKELKYR